MTSEEHSKQGQEDQPNWPDTRALPRSFFNAPLCTDLNDLSADVAFLGVPFDQGTFNRPGARYGPNGVRDVPFIYPYADPWKDEEARGYFDIDAGGVEQLKGVTFADCGNVTILPSDVEKNFDKLTRAVRTIVERGAFPVVVGGDHSITYPVVRALEKFEPLDVVHFDAHQDFTHHIQGVKYFHGSPIRRVSELAFVRNITSLGIRHARKEVYAEALERGVRTITTRQMKEMGPRQTAAEVAKAENIYITLDIDVLDPVYAPGTGTPVVGGLTYYELREALLEVPKRGRVVGLDVVEVAPPYDVSQVTALTAARLILDLLSVLFPPRG